MTEIVTTDPATGQDLKSYPAMDDEAIAARLAGIGSAQSDWARRPLASRAEHVAALADILEQRRDALARLATAEMGKRLAESLAEVDKCIATCRFYVDNADEIFAPRRVDGPGAFNEIRFEPLGTLLAVMPWNFPFWQVIRFAAPTLLLGNTVVLKHAPNTTGSALAIESAMSDAGFPNVLSTLVVSADRVPTVVERLIGDPAIAAVTFTGSTRTGAAVAAAAGRVAKKSVLELGGSDPFVLLENADLDLAVASAVTSRFGNCGQSCLAAKRFIVHRAIVDEFADRLVSAVEMLVVGDPLDEATNLGPMARNDLRTALLDQVHRSIEDGAELLAGELALPDRDGWWFPPMVLTGGERDVEMSVMSEETFGPVAVIATVADDDAAVHLANATQYGLAASVWSSDVDRAMAVGARIRSGALFVNQVVASDARLPFGGVAQSGYGRELGTSGAHEFANIRPVISSAMKMAP